MIMYSYVLIVFSLRRESLKLILVDEPPSRGGCDTPSVTVVISLYSTVQHHTFAGV
jgi:hypothetical protein